MISAFLILLLCTSFITLAPSMPANKKAMVVFLKLIPPFCSTEDACLPDFSPDLISAINAPRHSAQIYTAMLNGTMSPFIAEATYGNSHITFDAILNPGSSDGWFDAPHSLEDYNQSQNASIGRDALNLVKSLLYIDANVYNMLVVVTNIQYLFGYTTAIDQYSLVVLGENPADDNFFAVAGHELGHAHGLYHVIMGPYDIVGNSPVLVHYGGWSKAFAGWVPTITDMPCIGEDCEITTALDPIFRPGNNVLRIPIVSWSWPKFHGYLVECRSKSGYDNKIPEEGVIISRVVSFGTFENASVLVYPTGGADDFNAAMAPGESYTNEMQDLTITYLSKDASGRCVVKAEHGPIYAPDPYIRQYDPTDSGAGYLEYKSYDIWIDSQQNGWNVYPQGEGFYAEGTQSVPAGYGDPLWEGHENHINFIIRNDGFGHAKDFIADVFVTQPLILNIPGVNCDGPELNTGTLVASVKIDNLEPDEVYFGQVPYTPSTGASAQVTVAIRDYTGEITHANNIASETYAEQHIPQGVLASQDIGSVATALGELERSVSVQAALGCEDYPRYRFVRKVISAIDRKYWVTDFEQVEGILTPGEKAEIRLASLPPQGTQPGACEETQLELQAMLDDYFVPVGGFTYQTCVVSPSQITCEVAKQLLETGSEVTITGMLTPGDFVSAIAVQFTNPKGEVTIQNASLKENGGYTLDFKPDESGKWQAQAFWQGSSSSSPAQSDICAFEVESSKPEFTLNHNANCRVGPSTEFDVVISGRIGDVIPVEGRSKDALWLYGAMRGSHCWMALETGTLNVNPWTLPEHEAPVLKRKTPTTVPSLCSTYTSEAVCLRHKDNCAWKVKPSGAAVCEAR